MIKRLFLLKTIIAALLLTANCITYAAVPDSIRKNLEDFDYLTNFTEENHAVFPSIMEQGYKKTYESLKKKLRKQVEKGETGIEKAATEYVFWFYKNFDTHSWIDTPLWDSLEKTVSIDYSTLMEYQPQPVSCKVDEQTWLVRVPSCFGNHPTNEWVLQASKDYWESGCDYLIIDVRGNEGGNDAIWAPFKNMLADHKRERPFESYFRNTAYNQKFWEFVIEQVDNKQFYQEFLNKCKETGGKSEYKLWAANDCSDITPMSRPKRAAVMIDQGTASAGEALIQLYVRGVSNRTKVYGKEGTYGADLTGNVFQTKLPNAGYLVTYPTCMEYKEFLEYHVFGKNGFQPDVTIEIPYPKRLTDNIDEWVLWVADDLKKQ